MMGKVRIWIRALVLSQLIGAIVLCVLPDSMGEMLQTHSKQGSLVPGEKTMRVGPASTPPVIDGNLDDRCWRDATMASGFITVQGEWPREQTTGYVTYDDTCIYIAFYCNEPVSEEIKAETKGNDDLSIFGGDVVEIFLDTNHDRKTYYHFGVNPIGMRYEAYCDAGNGLRKADWNPDLELETRIGDQHWAVEMRIPFASLGTACPQPGTAWGINLGRERRAGHAESASWAMYLGSFNQPGKFGELIFGDYPDVSYSVLSVGDPKANHEVGIRLRNGKKSPLSVRTQWTVGASSQIATTRLGPKEEREIYIRSKDAASLETVDTLELALTVGNTKTGEIYDVRKGYREQSPAIEMLMDRYYYTPDVRQVQVDITRNIERAVLLKIEVGKEVGGKPVAGREISLAPGKDDYNTSFGIADWDSGRYVVAAHLLAEGGERLLSIHRVFFVKEEPAPARIPLAAPKVRIRSDGIILLDEEPFCPFLASTPAQSSLLVKDCFNVAESGFGLVSRPLTRRGVGLPGWTQAPGEIFVLLPEEEKMLEHIQRTVAAQKADPLLLYWFMAYEAQISMYRGEENRVPLNNVEELERISRFVKSVDPDHLTAIQIDCGNWADYKDCADIIEVACWSSSYARSLISNLIEDVDNVRHALGQGKPFVFWIGSSIPSADWRTAEEIRCASYLALMHGAAGIVFHMGHAGIDPSLTRHWSVYGGLAREIEELFPILTTSRQSRKAMITMDPPGVDYCVREYNDRFYIVAVNTSHSTVNARVLITGPAVISKRIRVLFENREIELTRNRFVDTFTSFEPHVYEFLPVLSSKHGQMP